MSGIIFINSGNSHPEKTLKLYDSEKEKEERIAKMVLERLSVTTDVSKAIQEIKELQNLLDQLEKRFK